MTPLTDSQEKALKIARKLGHFRWKAFKKKWTEGGDARWMLNKLKEYGYLERLGWGEYKVK